jgi:hypothetical protein
MSRKDYIKIASVLRDQYQAEEDKDGFVERTVDPFAWMLSQDNPRFNRERFYNYIIERR